MRFNAVEAGSAARCLHDQRRHVDVLRAEPRAKLAPFRLSTVVSSWDHCRGKVASFKLPRQVVFIEAFPMTGSGRIRMAELRDDARKRFGV